jgi:hypothetical protein
MKLRKQTSTTATPKPSTLQQYWQNKGALNTDKMHTYWFLVYPVINDTRHTDLIPAVYHVINDNRHIVLCWFLRRYYVRLPCSGIADKYFFFLLGPRPLHISCVGVARCTYTGSLQKPTEFDPDDPELIDRFPEYTPDIDIGDRPPTHEICSGWFKLISLWGFYVCLPCSGTNVLQTSISSFCWVFARYIFHVLVLVVYHQYLYQVNTRESDRWVPDRPGRNNSNHCKVFSKVMVSFVNKKAYINAGPS